MANRTTLTEGETAFVSAQRVARLATSDKEGNPHVIPVCYAFDGQRFYTPLDEKPKRVAESKLRRVRNIETRPEVALVIDYYDDDWSRLGYVLVQGQAELLQPASPSHAQAFNLVARALLSVQVNGPGKVCRHRYYSSARGLLGTRSNELNRYPFFRPRLSLPPSPDLFN